MFWKYQLILRKLKYLNIEIDSAFTILPIPNCPISTLAFTKIGIFAVLSVNPESRHDAQAGKQANIENN